MEPKDFARIILRRKRTVVTAILIVMLTAFVGSMRKAPTYVAECEVLFGAVLSDPSDTHSDPIETIGDLNSNVHFFRSPAIAAEASKLLDGRISAAEIQSKVHAEMQPNTQFFKIQIADSPGHDSPEAGKRSGEICNAVGTAYVNYKKEVARDFFVRALDQNRNNQKSTRRDYLANQSQLAQARASGDQNAVLELTISQNELLRVLGDLTAKARAFQNQIDNGVDGGPRLTSPSGGGRRIGADRKRDVFLGFLVGLMFGIGIAILREYLDDTVRDKESTQRDLGLPVLANLPATEGMEGFVESSSATVEAARQLRATLASLGFPHERSMLVITSTLAKSRSTTLVALAAAVAESGRSVLVIGSDMRSGRTHEGFGIANTMGLANVVRGQVAFEKAIRPAPGMEGVYVLPSGPVIGNPGELLSSEEMAFVLRKARRWADVVLLDAPPVLAAADASILGAYADGAVLVLAAGHTNRAQANEAKEQLVAAGARVLGAVLIGSDAANGRDGNGYGMDELPPMMPFSEWGAYDTVEPVFDDGEPVVTATARTAPRPAGAKRAPAKKTAAARVDTKPTRAARNGASARNGAATRSASNGARTNGARKSAAGGARTSGATNGARTSGAKKSSGSGGAARGSSNASRRSPSPMRVTAAKRRATTAARRSATVTNRYW